VAKSLLSDELFCGWGVRTLASNEIRYNPMSYHNGSVWPHDNALAARGLARYGFHNEAVRIFSALLEASAFMELHRLPELFCGFHRRSPSEGPTLYPVACSPQAWAAGSIYLFLEACLGIEVKPRDNSISFTSHILPEFLQGMTIENLSIGDSDVDLAVRQGNRRLQAEVLRQSGNSKIDFASAE
jgi:glycogen debranching enzyme